MDFYITLIGNTASLSHKLPVPIDVCGYEVGVINFQLPQEGYANFKETDVHVIKTNKEGKQVVTIVTLPKGNYSMFSFTRMLRSRLSAKVRVENGANIIQITCPDKTEYEFNDYLKNTLGLNNNWVKSKVTGILKSLLDPVILTGDIIDPQMTNIGGVRLLNIGPSTNFYTEYFPVNKTALSEITVKLLDINLEAVDLLRGSAVVVLHFRKINK